MEEQVVSTNEANKQRFLSLCKELIHRDGIDKLLKWLESSDFFVAPASSRYHLSCEGGLLQHSLNVYDEMKRLVNVYKDKVGEVSEESIAIAALFHDLCKVNFYKASTRNVKVQGMWKTVPSYEIDEKFMFGGHGSKSVYIIQTFIPLNTVEAAAINCHMGFSTDEYVGKVYEKNTFAWLLHVADEAAAFVLEANE